MSGEKSRKIKSPFNIYAIIISCILILLGFVSIWWIAMRQSLPPAEQPTAHVYQNGILIRQIPLDEVTQTYSFTVTGENGCTNVVEVRPGSIGILNADCPDQICVQQGFISSSLLPITCLPNRLVIEITLPDNDNGKEDSP